MYKLLKLANKYLFLGLHEYANSFLLFKVNRSGLHIMYSTFQSDIDGKFLMMVCKQVI